MKVYAAHAGAQHVPLPELAAMTALARATRMAVVGAGIAALGHLLRRPLRSGYGVYLVGLAVGFGLGLAMVVRAWS